MNPQRASSVYGSFSERLYRGLIRSVFPKAFRVEYEPHLLQVFTDRLYEVRRERRSGAILAFWYRTVVDLLVSGLRLRIRASLDSLSRWRRNRRRKPRRDWMGSLLSDIRYGLRALLKARGFTFVAVLTLAFGIGANTAIFSVLNGIVLTPLPYHEPDRVVRVWPPEAFTKGLLAEFERQTSSYSSLSGFSWVNLTLTGIGEPEEFWGASVSVNHFDLLGVAPAIGRTFLPEEQEPGRDRVVILSHGLWERRFGANPAIVGQAIQLGGSGVESRIVVGVMPRDYRPLIERCQAWLPMTVDPTNFSDYEGTASSLIFGRLKENVSVEMADDEIRSLAVRLKSEGEDLQWMPDERIRGANVVPALDALVGEVRSRLVILILAVGLVLLIGCTNVANLLLARGTARSREIGIRLAIGARRSRIVRQLLTESTLLGVIGGAAGICVASWTVAVFKANLPPGVPRTDLIEVDIRVLGFAFILSLLSSLIFGLLPAFRATKGDLGTALHDVARGTSMGGGRARLNAGLVVLETALAVILVIGAGLMVKSFWLLNRVDPGFDATNLVTMRVSPPSTRYADDESVRAYYTQVVERLEADPEVTSVGMLNYLPMTAGNIGLLYHVEGNPLPDGSHRPRANARIVLPGHFRAMGIPVLRGRELEITDVDDGPIVVNETMARHMSPDGDVVGQRIGGFFGDAMFTVVGVVADIHQHGLQMDPRPEMYFSFYSWTNSNMYLLIRTSGDAEQTINPLQRVIWSVDENVPISRARTMEDVIGRSVADSRFLTQLLVGLAILALVLGAIGVFGVLSYTVRQRTREIGVRMALGAQQRTVLRAALRQGIALVTGGVVFGIAVAIVATRLLSGFLFGVSTTDPTTFVFVGVFLMLVSVVASLIPAIRASRIDPMVALRLE